MGKGSSICLYWVAGSFHIPSIPLHLCDFSEIMGLNDLLYHWKCKLEDSVLHLRGGLFTMVFFWGGVLPSHSWLRAAPWSFQGKRCSEVFAMAGLLVVTLVFLVASYPNISQGPPYVVPENWLDQANLGYLSQDLTLCLLYENCGTLELKASWLFCFKS